MNSTLIRIATIGAGALALAGSVAIGAQPRAPQPRAAGAMTFAALEQRAIAMGISPTELKIKHRVAEIEGRDRSGRKIEVKLDPRTGAELVREFDD